MAFNQPGQIYPRQATLLSAVTATGASSAFNGQSDYVTFYIKAASVTIGATIQFECQSPEGDWHVLGTSAISANGNTIVQYTGSLLAVRANITSRTDGTYTVSATRQ